MNICATRIIKHELKMFSYSKARYVHVRGAETNESECCWPCHMSWHVILRIFVLNSRSSMFYLTVLFWFYINLTGADFIKVGRKAQIIEKALSICALRLRSTF